MKEINITNTEEKIYEHTTKNGLKVYIWPYDLTEEINMTLTVKFGSVHTNFESDNEKITLPNGIAHFLEHLKFNEKENVTAHDFFNKIGSYTNAYTTYDHTSYEVVCNDQIEDNLKHLLEFVFNPYFTKKLINKEKPIVIEESNLSLDDPYLNGYKILLSNTYIYSNKKYLVTGTSSDIKNYTINDVLNAYNNFYIPDNMFLVVTGKVNPFEIVKIVDTFTEKMPKYNKFNVKILNSKEPDKIVKKHDELTTNVNSEKLLMAFKISKNKLKNYSKPIQNVILNIILEANFSVTSKFNEELIDNNLVEEFFYSKHNEDDHILVYFEISSKYPKEVYERVINKFASLEVNEDDFKRIQKCIIASSILGYEHPEEVNDNIRFDLIQFGKIINDVTKIIKDIEYKDVINFLNNIKKYEVTEVTLKPLK